MSQQAPSPMSSRCAEHGEDRERNTDAPDPPGPHDDTAGPSAHEPDGTSFARARQQMPARASQLDERTSQNSVKAKFAEWGFSEVRL